MSTIDTMIAEIPDDFGVELIGRDSTTALFGALRTKHCQLDVWHFVSITVSGREIWDRQWHVPRFQMASEMKQMSEVLAQSGGGMARPIHAETAGLHLLMADSRTLSVRIPKHGDVAIDPAFTARMMADVPLLGKAAGKVRMVDGRCIIPGLMTPACYEVESSAQPIIEAIAFEKTVRRRMTAANFGIYSAFSTYRDFSSATHRPDEDVRGLLNYQLTRDPSDAPEELLELLAEFQKQFFPRPIWGPGISVSADEAAAVLSQVNSRLTPAQWTQLTLMIGMHESELFLTLATILGTCSFSTYAWHACREFAAHSPDEQDRRTETAYIRLFGELGWSLPRPADFTNH
jgi:hypothetical protein